jgi:FAD/FMN-containing dehydrogenase
MKKAPNHSNIFETLKDNLQGDIFVDEQLLRKYSRDQSIYEIIPRAVALPQSLEDIRNVILFSAAEKVPVTPRGGGSGTAGSALGQGIVIALKRGGFLSTITDFHVAGGVPHVTAEAGVYHSALQAYLKARGFCLPADPSSGAISQIGGNIATKASGPHAFKHGSIDRFLEHILFFTDRGELVDTSDESTIPSRIRKGLGELTGRIVKDREARRLLESRKDMKIASGYNMFPLLRNLPAGKLIAQLFTGSVGTLGFITRATLIGKPYEPEKAAMLLYFEELAEAGEAVSGMRQAGVAAIEIINRETVSIINRRLGRHENFPDQAHILLVEFEGKERFEQIDQVRKQIDRARYRLIQRPRIAAAGEEIEKLWEIRKQILPVIGNPEPHLKALSVINDVAVHPEDLTSFMAGLQTLFKKHGIETLIYGHAGSGNLHLRPLFDLTRRGLKKRIRLLADDVYALVFRYHGTIAAEHGMGRLRAPYLEREWGKRMIGYMKEVKSIFDPGNLFNPDVMFSDRPITDFMQDDLLSQCFSKECDGD